MAAAVLSNSTRPGLFPRTLHPLDPLTAGEISESSRLTRGLFPTRSLHIKAITLIEPPKKDLLKYLSAERSGSSKLQDFPRRTNVLFFPRGVHQLFEAQLNISAGSVEKVEEVDPSFFAPTDTDESVTMRDICLAHPEVQRVVKEFGLPENTTVECDTWPFGRQDHQEKRRLMQCYLFHRDPTRNSPAGNHYDFPLPFAPVFDYTTGELVEIIHLPTSDDHKTGTSKKYRPHKAKEYHHDLRGTPVRNDLKPLIVSQPQGVSFSVDGHLVCWQKWRFRLSFNWREGLVLHDVTYDGRELFYRLSLSEMFVPYGDPRNPYHRKSVFDIGDIGAGVAANNLQLGCDCLGVIKYFTFNIHDSDGNPVEKANAVCMHEIDDGIGWKHTNTRHGIVSITRSRVLVLQSIITVGNYDYIFAWKLDQAAALHYEIKATGILSTVALDPGVQVPWGIKVNEGVMAPYHQHIFCLRIDPSIDGSANTLVEEDSLPMPIDSFNEFGVGYITKQRKIETSAPSDFAINRAHKIINPTITNPVTGRTVGYSIVSPIKQMLLAHPDSWHSRRAKYARHPYWVTSYRDDELFAAGKYTYQSFEVHENVSSTNGSNGDVASWAARKDNVDGQDIVIWHSISLTHNSRIEDYPVMPADTMSVTLRPSGFFDSNPALDVPQSNQITNESVLYEEGLKDCCDGKALPKSLL